MSGVGSESGESDEGEHRLAVNGQAQIGKPAEAGWASTDRTPEVARKPDLEFPLRRGTGGCTGARSMLRASFIPLVPMLRVGTTLSCEAPASHGNPRPAVNGQAQN
ncbi:MAG: hypothetical protein D6814_03085, partial [Calditrichaeota bacterium]